MKPGDRIEVYEVINSMAAWKTYRHDWIPKDHFKLGSVWPEYYYGKEGYCVWNMHIHSGGDYAFKLAFRPIGCFIIKTVK